MGTILSVIEKSDTLIIDEFIPRFNFVPDIRTLTFGFSEPASDGGGKRNDIDDTELEEAKTKTEKKLLHDSLEAILTPTDIGGLGALILASHDKKTIPKIDIFPYLFFPSSSKLIAANDNYPRYFVYRATFEFSAPMFSPKYTTPGLSPDYTHAEIYGKYTSTGPYRTAFTGTALDPFNSGWPSCGFFCPWKLPGHHRQRSRHYGYRLHLRGPNGIRALRSLRNDSRGR